MTHKEIVQLLIENGIGIEVDKRKDGVLVFRAYNVYGVKSTWTEKDLLGVINNW